MEGKTLSQVWSLLDSTEFEKWFDVFRSLRLTLDHTREEYSDPLTHWVFTAGEYENLSVQAHADFQALDDSFERLSDFETQRRVTTQLWELRQGLEKELEDRRRRTDEIRAKLTARDKGRRLTADLSEAEKRKKSMEDLGVEIDRLATEYDDISSRYIQATQKRERYWREVEKEWNVAFRTNMARAEYAFAARHARAIADRLAGHEVTDVELDNSSNDLGQANKISSNTSSNHNSNHNSNNNSMQCHQCRINNKDNKIIRNDHA